MKFINRKEELKFLEDQWDKDGSSFIPIYGRRRVGKSRLITHFLKNKNHVYHLAAQESKMEQVNSFKDTLAEKIDDEFLKKTSVSDWKELFEYLKKDPPDDIIIVIDEVTYIIKRDGSFPSYLQGFWDNHLKNTNTMLILCGSLVGLMKESILNYSSPLYGRRTGQIHLKPLKPVHLNEIIDDKEKIVQLYSVFGGVPKYYEEIDINKEFPEIIDSIVSPEQIFFEEGTFLLAQEFKEMGNYNSILKSISSGNTELSDITNDIGLGSRPMSNYLDRLYELGFIDKIKPVTNTQKRYRGFNYYLNDNFLDFWFKFIFPNRSHIEERNFGYSDIEEKLNLFISKKFEEVCKMGLSKGYSKVGKWWYKEDEIDIVALNEEKNELLIGECKWSKNPVDKGVYYNLKEKEDKVKWKNSERTVEYVIFSKSGFTDDLKEIDEDNLSLVDLDNLW